jgi:hypothetical protein
MNSLKSTKVFTAVTPALEGQRKPTTWSLNCQKGALHFSLLKSQDEISTKIQKLYHENDQDHHSFYW